MKHWRKFRSLANSSGDLALIEMTFPQAAVKIIHAGDGSKFPIEAEYLQPEVHSLMTIDRPIVRAGDIDRVVLMVGKKEEELKGTHVARYLRHGKTAQFASSKSKAVPVPERPSCSGRDPWYDLTKLVESGRRLLA